MQILTELPLHVTATVLSRAMHVSDQQRMNQKLEKMPFEHTRIQTIEKYANTSNNGCTIHRCLQTVYI